MEVGLAVLVTGDRDYDDEWIVGVLLAGIYFWNGPPVTLIHGAARGADTIANDTAKNMTYAVLSYEAEWKRWGKSAGRRRNRKMLDKLLAMQRRGWTIVVVAFHDYLAGSKGTKHMVQISNEAEVPVYLVSRP